jgi:hypothetical protein
MPTTIATTPQYPAAGASVRVDFSVTGGGNYLRGYYTDAPLGSEIKDALAKSGASRIDAFSTDSGKPWLFTPDAGGVYTLQVEQLSKGASDYGGGYEGSPEGFLSETAIDSSTVTLAVGQRVTQRVGFGGDTATLTLFVIGDYVRPSSFDLQGFTSPSLDDARTDKAKTAALNGNVLTAVYALANQAVTTLLGSLSTVFNSLASAYTTHAASHIYHINADTTNALTAADLTPDSPQGLRQSVTRLVTLLDRHMRNDDGGGTGTALAGSGYHNSDTTDWRNALLVTSGGDTLDTFVAIADAWRAYAGHFGTLALHQATDVVNTPGTLPPLLDLQRLFLAEIQKQNPTAPASVNAGVTALVHGAGFEES